MAGGFFDDSIQPPQAPVSDEPTRGSTSDASPGGFFGDGSTAQIDRTASGSASDAENYAEQARGWAVGPTTEPLSGWSATNNSKYYSGQSEASANAASRSASAAASSAQAAERSAENAADSATAARGFRDQARAADSEAQIAAAEAAASAAGAARDSEGAAESAREAAADAAKIADTEALIRGFLAEIRSIRDQVAVDSEEIQRIAMEVQIDSEGAQQSAIAAAASATSAATSAAGAKTDSEEAAASALRAKSWAVGPSGTGESGTDVNNAHYWALRAEAAGNVETVQFEVTIPLGAPGITYNPGTSTINIVDSDLYINDDPIVTYNGIVLTDSDHYTWTETSITFTTAVGVTNDDCITVTAGAERTSSIMTAAAANPANPVAGQFYFNTGDNTLRIYNGTAWRSISSA